jgi:hypothetical protein
MIGSLSTNVLALQALFLQLDGMLATVQGKALVAIVALALVVFVGRFVLGVAWKLLRIAIVAVGVLWLLSVFVPGLI